VQEDPQGQEDPQKSVSPQASMGPHWPTQALAQFIGTAGHVLFTPKA
jgi:hypothetical protein